jgi:hypothetical protein
MYEALENLHDSEYIDRAWENIKEIIRTLAKENKCLHELTKV